MRRTSSSTFRHPLLHVLLALASLLLHLSNARDDLELIGPITTTSIDMTLIGIDETERYKEWQTTTANFIMDYFKDSEDVFEVNVEVAMLYETVTEIPIGTYTGNAGVPGSEWKLTGERNRRQLADSVRVTYNQVTSYKSEDPTVYDEAYIVEEPFRGDPEGYIARLKSSSRKGAYDAVVEVGVGIPPPTPPPTLKPKFTFSPSPKKKKSSSGDSTLYIIIGAACGGVLILVIIIILVIRRRRKGRGLGGAPQNILVGSGAPQNPPHSIFTGSTPQTISTGVESGNSWGTNNNIHTGREAVTAIAATTQTMHGDREEVLPSGEVRIHILAPKGKLGLTVENLPWGGPSYVAKVSGKSPLFGRVQIGDKVMAIDGNDVQQVSAKDISKLLARKKKNPQRQLTIMRGESKGNDTQMQPHSVPNGMNNNMGNGPYMREGSQRDDRDFQLSMNRMGNDPYGMGREETLRDYDRNSQHNRSLSSGMNRMENDPYYGMGREASQRDYDRDFQRNRSLSSGMNRMEIDQYGMGREETLRDDRHFQRRHSVSSGMNSMDNDPYSMTRGGSQRDDRHLDLNYSAHGIRGEASRRDARHFERRYSRSRSMDMDMDPYGIGREGSQREDRHFQRNYSVSSGMSSMGNDTYGMVRDGSQRDDRDFDFNPSAPNGMNMESDPYEIGREGGRREGRDFQLRRSSPGDMNMDSEFIHPYSHEGNSHINVEPAAQYADSKYTVVTAIAPKGKLGVVLEDSSDGGPSFVSEIHEGSVLKGEVMLFDRIASIDGQDVKELKAFYISKLLAHKSRNVERKILFLREKIEGDQNKYKV